ncbi:S8 family peptidase [Myceligenerans salitolerans]|uniref:S8 family peptidase n=1 Tax=Myceligenerans salitolerans TaxID=1230528 RepID=A0ABS3I438_9MICO|nr:S8 family peptidase [Myceligenerans salitolerans]MBO0607776.1 S8 family peptidase [Myceligenerans salitolerans]
MKRVTPHDPGSHRSPRARRWAATAAGLAVIAAPALAAPGIAHAAAPSDDKSRIIAADSPDAVPGEYIVVLDDSEVGIQQVNGKAHGLVKKYGGTVKDAYKTAIRGFSAKMTPGQADKLSRDPSVAYVEQNQVVHATATQAPTPSWGLDRIDQRDLPLDDSYTYPNTGSGVTAYIIDTGIRTSHQDFGGRAVHGTDTVDGDSDATDCNGHGTHVAGTVGGSAYGVAKGVTLVGVRVLDCAGSGTYAGVIDGIDWVTADHGAGEPAVANMSLGGGFSQAVNDAVADSIADGVTYALAAGNEYAANACNTSPASTPEAITVGATQSNDARASYSNIGTCLDIFAPGSSITSAWHTSNSATNTISGTSMASPHVAGAAALVTAANPGYTPQQVRDQLVADATTGAVTNRGSGSPDALLYVGDEADTPPDPDPEPEPGCSASSTADVDIDDNATSESPITISGCAAPSGTATVDVDIVHTWVGDLTVSLVSPDGSVHTLRERSGGSANDITETYTVDVSGESPDGTWVLRVQDSATWDTGYIDGWSLSL